MTLPCAVTLSPLLGDVLGQEIDVGTHAQMTSALVRIASRLGLQRRQRDVTPSVEEYLRSKRQELPS